MENSVEFLKKLKVELPYDLAIPLLGTNPKQLKVGTWRGIIIYSSWKLEATLLSVDGQTKCGLHTMEYYSSLKSLEILTDATAWMHLENITPSEIYQSWKRQIMYDSTYMTYLE